MDSKGTPGLSFLVHRRSSGSRAACQRQKPTLTIGRYVIWCRTSQSLSQSGS